MKTVLGVKSEANFVSTEPEAFRLGDVDVLPASGMVRGPEGERMLDPKVMAVLLRLSAADGEIVSKDTLMSDVWGDIIVTDFALSRCIYQLRKNLGSVSGQKESPIKTLPKRGYCLTWPMEECGDEGRSQARRPWLSWLVAFTAFAVLVGAATWQNWRPINQSQVRPSIAVMPFTDLTPARDMGYFGDGIAQALSTELGHIKEIDVIAHRSSSSLKDAGLGFVEIATSLDVRYLVEGKVSRKSDAVLVFASLIDARSGRQVWSQTFKSAAEQPNSLQNDMAVKIAGHLAVSLGDPHSHGGTDSHNAFEAYLRAIEADEDAVASVFIDEALAHDRDYAHALIAKANLIYRGLWRGSNSEVGAWKEAKPLIDRALSITDQLPGGHALIAGFQLLLEDYDAAEFAVQRALEINPSHTGALVHLSRLMARTGRFREAVAVAKRNVRLDPLNPDRHQQLGARLWELGDIEAGKASFERSLELDAPNFGGWSRYALRLADLETPLQGFLQVARLQQNSHFRAQFYGPVPEIDPVDVLVFGLWFGFIGDYERERQMLKLQSEMADSVRLHRELAWALIGEGDSDQARIETWTALNGLPREDITNFQVAYLALKTGQELDRVMAHYQKYWPDLFGELADAENVQKMVTIGAALIHREQGNISRANQLLHLIQQEGPDPFATAAMASAHLGDIDAALDTLENHIGRGGHFSYIYGDPFWAPLTGEPRFQAIVESQEEVAANIRAEVEAMIGTGQLVLPGQLVHQDVN